MRLMLVLASLMVVITTGTTSSSSNNFLYNLDDDPYESDNVVDKSSYSSIVTKITKLHESYASSVVKPTEISKSTMEAGFAKCGGVCSFLDKGDKDKDEDKKKDSTIINNETTDTQSTERRRQLRHKTPDPTSSSSTPNIVFVLVDDWGYNDVGYRSSYLSWTTPTIDKLASEGIKLENYYTSYYCMPARRYQSSTSTHVAPSLPLCHSPPCMNTRLTHLPFPNALLLYTICSIDHHTLEHTLLLSYSVSLPCFYNTRLTHLSTIFKPTYYFCLPSTVLYRSNTRTHVTPLSLCLSPMF